jgi:5-formyltetrahydrofolate cyclo-ligase
MRIEPSQKSRKQELRKDFRRRRAGIGEETRNLWNTLINQHVVEYAGQTGPSTVAAYLAFDGEPDLSPALQFLLARGVRLALPVVQEAPGKPFITFNQWSGETVLRPNRYGIDEPQATEPIRITEIDLVLIPLVGWDRSGGRLGMGASFYDRLFQAFAESEHPVRMGIGYALQEVDMIPSEPWDIRLHGVVTETGWFTCGD